MPVAGTDRILFEGLGEGPFEVFIDLPDDGSGLLDIHAEGLEPPAEDAVVLTARRGGLLEGTVVDMRGRPLAGPY